MHSKDTKRNSEIHLYISNSHVRIFYFYAPKILRLEWLPHLSHCFFGSNKSHFWLNIYTTISKYGYCAGDKIENEMGGACSAYGGRESRVQGFGGETWGKETPRCRWEDNIKMDLQEVGCVGMDWIELAKDRDSWRALVNVVMNLRVP
jgi:hypothetical protein